MDRGSPFRPEHQRKNWFVGIEVLEQVENTHFHPRDVKWETMRASGPGGQHVNRTESAVRVTHMPTGIQASAGRRSVRSIEIASWRWRGSVRRWRMLMRCNMVTRGRIDGGRIRK